MGGTGFNISEVESVVQGYVVCWEGRGARCQTSSSLDLDD